MSTDIENTVEPSKKTNLVLSGGGVKGIIMIGALKALEDKGLLKNITSISTTSVGSLIGSLYVAGYSIEDLKEFLSIVDISKIKSLQASRLLSQFGLDNGSKLMLVVEKMLEAKNLSPDITLLDLYKKSNITLHITGTCLNDKKIYYFSHLTYPHMKLKTAIRISTSVPLWFTPVEFEGNIFVDGGCMENYPISIFNDELDLTMGIHLTDEKESVKSIDCLETYLINLFQCFDESCATKSVCGYEKYTIQLNIKNTSIFNLNVDENTKKEMFEFGYTTAMQSEIIKNFTNTSNINKNEATNIIY